MAYGPGARAPSCCRTAAGMFSRCSSLLRAHPAGRGERAGADGVSRRRPALSTHDALARRGAVGESRNVRRFSASAGGATSHASGSSAAPAVGPFSAVPARAAPPGSPQAAALYPALDKAEITGVDQLVRSHVENDREHRDAYHNAEHHVAWNYAQLDRVTKAMAEGWFSHGINPGDRFGAMMRADVEMLLSYLACMRGGFSFVSIPPHLNGTQLFELVRRHELRALALPLLTLQRELQPLVPELQHPNADSPTALHARHLPSLRQLYVTQHDGAPPRPCQPFLRSIPLRVVTDTLRVRRLHVPTPPSPALFCAVDSAAAAATNVALLSSSASSSSSSSSSAAAASSSSSSSATTTDANVHIAHEQAAMVGGARRLAAALRLAVTARVASTLPYGVPQGLTLGPLLAFTAGGQYVDVAGARFDAVRLQHALATEQPSVLCAPPTHLAALVDYAARSTSAIDRTVPSVQQLVVPVLGAADARLLDTALLGRVQRVFPALRQMTCGLAPPAVPLFATLNLNTKPETARVLGAAVDGTQLRVTGGRLELKPKNATQWVDSGVAASIASGVVTLA